MEGSWALANFLWAVLIVVMIAIFVNEFNKTPEQKKRDAEMARERYKKEQMSRKIVEVTPLGVSRMQNKRGGLGGALFGGFIGGVPGAVVGAMLRTGKCVPMESFAVKYGNGEVVIRECPRNSSEYKALMKYVKQ